MRDPFDNQWSNTAEKTIESHGQKGPGKREKQISRTLHSRAR